MSKKRRAPAERRISGSEVIYMESYPHLPQSFHGLRCSINVFIIMLPVIGPGSVWRSLWLVHARVTNLSVSLLSNKMFRHLIIRRYIPRSLTGKSDRNHRHTDGYHINLYLDCLCPYLIIDCIGTILDFLLSAQSKPGETLGRRATGLTVNGFNVRRAARENFWRLLCVLE